MYELFTKTRIIGIIDMKRLKFRLFCSINSEITFDGCSFSMLYNKLMFLLINCQSIHAQCANQYSSSCLRNCLAGL